MTLDVRDAILQRLRAAAPDHAVAAPDVRGFYADQRARSPVESRAQRSARFCAQMAFWHGEVVRVTPDNWAATLRAQCLAKGVKTLLYGPRSRHAAALEGAAIDGLTPYERPIDEWKPELFRDIDAGFTSTRGAIAETGTLIVWPDASEPRLLSLVPPIHFALLDSDTLYPTLFDALVEQGWSAPMPSNALLISGPSKTADIQITLAYGAHGPKELVVLLLDHSGDAP